MSEEELCLKCNNKMKWIKFSDRWPELDNLNEFLFLTRNSCDEDFTVYIVALYDTDCKSKRIVNDLRDGIDREVRESEDFWMLFPAFPKAKKNE